MLKAYDRIEWCFVQKVMKWMGFRESLISTILDCLSILRYSLLIHGVLMGEIIPQHGLRQGDILSPYLFTLCVKGLSIALKKATNDNLISRAMAIYRGTRISYVFFADDSLLFYKANETKSDQILKVLHEYEFYLGNV